MDEDNKSLRLLFPAQAEADACRGPHESGAETNKNQLLPCTNCTRCRGMAFYSRGFALSSFGHVAQFEIRVFEG